MNSQGGETSEPGKNGLQSDWAGWNPRSLAISLHFSGPQFPYQKGHATPVTPVGKIKLHEAHRDFTTMPGTWLESINNIFLVHPTLDRWESILPRGEGDKGVYWRMVGALWAALRTSFSVVLPTRLRVSLSAL